MGFVKILALELNWIFGFAVFLEDSLNCFPTNLFSFLLCNDISNTSDTELVDSPWSC